MRELFRLGEGRAAKGQKSEESVFAWEPKGNFLATGGQPGVVHVWDRHGAATASFLKREAPSVSYERRVAATPRPRRGSSVDGSRRRRGRDVESTSRRRRGRDVESPWTGRDATGVSTLDRPAGFARGRALE